MKTGAFLATLAGYASFTSAYKVELDGMSYETTVDVSAPLAVTQSQCDVSGKIEAGDWAAVKAAYEGSKAQDAALAYTSANEFDAMYAAYYGDEGFINTGLLEAMDNSGDFAKMADSAGARAEATAKGVVDQIAIKETMRYLGLATSVPMVGNEGDVKMYWDHAVASYFGLEDTMKCGIYARGQKRASNYNTYAPNDSKTAAANFNVLEAFLAGVAGVGAGDEDAFDKAVSTVITNIMSIYVQASLRYLYLLDMDVTDDRATSDHQGEGRAFWQCIEPVYSSLSQADKAKTHFDAINNAYNLAVAPAGTTRYCMGKEYFMTVMPEGMTAAHIGTFENDAIWECPAGKPIVTDAAPDASSSAPAAAPAEAAPASSDSAASTASFAAVPLFLGAVYALMA